MRRTEGQGIKLPAVLFGLLVAAGILLAILQVNHFPLLTVDTAVLFLYVLVVAGIPAGLGFGVLAFALGRVPRVRQSVAVSAAALLLLSGMILVLVLLALRDGGLAAAWFRRTFVLALFLVAVIAWGRPSIPVRHAKLIAGATLALVLGIGWPTVAGSTQLRPDGTMLEPVRPGPVRHHGRIVLIGVDGLCWETLQRWENQEENEDLKWFRENARIGPLSTFNPTASPLIWTTVATGTRPRDHGILGFTSWSLPGLERTLVRIPRLAGAFFWFNGLRWLGLAEQRPISSREMRRLPFWEIIEDPERPVDVVGWWATWPAAPHNGRLVSDKFYFWREQLLIQDETPVRRTTYPPDLESELTPLRRAPDRITAEQIASFIRIADDEAEALSSRPYRHHEVLSELPLAFTMDETYYSVAERFLEDAAPLGIFGFYFRGIDLVSHSAMHLSSLYPETSVAAGQRERYGELLSRYYAYTFARLRGLVEKSGEDSLVIIVSDHGFERTGDAKFSHPSAPPGVIITLGAGSEKADPEVSASVYDVAPTILSLVGYPVADEMPGRPLLDLFPDLDASAGPVTHRASYGNRQTRMLAMAGNAAAEAEMLELLRSLGYIE